MGVQTNAFDFHFGNARRGATKPLDGEAHPTACERSNLSLSKETAQITTIRLPAGGEEWANGVVWRDNMTLSNNTIQYKRSTHSTKHLIPPSL